MEGNVRTWVCLVEVSIWGHNKTSTCTCLVVPSYLCRKRGANNSCVANCSPCIQAITSSVSHVATGLYTLAPLSILSLSSCILRRVLYCLTVQAEFFCRTGGRGNRAHIQWRKQSILSGTYPYYKSYDKSWDRRSFQWCVSVRIPSVIFSSSPARSKAARGSNFDLVREKGETPSDFARMAALTSALTQPPTRQMPLHASPTASASPTTASSTTRSQKSKRVGSGKETGYPPRFERAKEDKRQAGTRPQQRRSSSEAAAKDTSGANNTTNAPTTAAPSEQRRETRFTTAEKRRQQHPRQNPK